MNQELQNFRNSLQIGTSVYWEINPSESAMKTSGVVPQNGTGWISDIRDSSSGKVYDVLNEYKKGHSGLRLTEIFPPKQGGGRKSKKRSFKRSFKRRMTRRK